MNIVTRALSKNLRDRRLKGFIAHWDKLEALIIRTYKSRQTGPEDEREFQKLSAWLRRNYPRVQDTLQPYWQESLAWGEKTQQDPYLRLISARHAGDFVGDWKAMQTLPEAREALNKYLLQNNPSIH
ncbi:MAG: hypothetical protein EHM70_06435 [Chloroflexota bacterium]|nr:MAG: hypothetical protein EHM70_06435 [Chloroflexota bacterium]